MGQKEREYEILGNCTEPPEKRSAEDIFIACTDKLKMLYSVMVDITKSTPAGGRTVLSYTPNWAMYFADRVPYRPSLYRPVNGQDKQGPTPPRP
jgi:hypothetical protein